MPQCRIFFTLSIDERSSVTSIPLISIAGIPWFLKKLSIPENRIFQNLVCGSKSKAGTKSEEVILFGFFVSGNE